MGVAGPGGDAGPRLLFVYNADGGWMNGAIDLAHKTLSPSTYACRLCAVTYGPLGMRQRWRAFVATLPYPAIFLHRDAFRAAFPAGGVALPAVLLAHDGALTPLIDAAAFAGLRDLPALEDALTAAAERHAGTAAREAG